MRGRNEDHGHKCFCFVEYHNEIETTMRSGHNDTTNPVRHQGASRPTTNPVRPPAPIIMDKKSGTPHSAADGITLTPVIQNKTDAPIAETPITANNAPNARINVRRSGDANQALDPMMPSVKAQAPMTVTSVNISSSASSVGV